ncbi:unnamed protein product, partial [Prorocentrum cordatum]
MGDWGMAADELDPRWTRAAHCAMALPTEPTSTKSLPSASSSAAAAQGVSVKWQPLGAWLRPSDEPPARTSIAKLAQHLHWARAQLAKRAGLMVQRPVQRLPGVAKDVATSRVLPGKSLLAPAAAEEVALLAPTRGGVSCPGASQIDPCPLAVKAVGEWGSSRSVHGSMRRRGHRPPADATPRGARSSRWPGGARVRQATFACGARAASISIVLGMREPFNAGECCAARWGGELQLSRPRGARAELERRTMDSSQLPSGAGSSVVVKRTFIEVNCPSAVGSLRSRACSDSALFELGEEAVRRHAQHRQGRAAAMAGQVEFELEGMSEAETTSEQDHEGEGASLPCYAHLRRAQEAGATPDHQLPGVGTPTFAGLPAALAALPGVEILAGDAAEEARLERSEQDRHAPEWQSADPTFGSDSGSEVMSSGAPSGVAVDAHDVRQDLDLLLQENQRLVFENQMLRGEYWVPVADSFAVRDGA